MTLAGRRVISCVPRNVRAWLRRLGLTVVCFGAACGARTGSPRGTPSTETAVAQILAACPVDCGAPAFSHPSLRRVRAACERSDGADALAELARWYEATAQRAQRLFHDEDAGVTNAERREFLHDFVEIPTAPLAYDLVLFALDDSLASAAVAWLSERHVVEEQAYARWLERAASPSNRGAVLRGCIETLNRVTGDSLAVQND